MLETGLKTIFWVCVVFIVYVYMLYPVLLGLLSRLFPTSQDTAGSHLPTVSLIISAYNERAVIGTKLANSLNLNYPRRLMEILVVSDCSDDGTDDIVRQHRAEGVRLVRQPERLGKSAGLNIAVPKTSGDIIVFSDANAIYEPTAIHQLVRHFSNPRVGYVVGNARYAEHPGETASEGCEGLYWKLETWLKQKESQFGSVVGGDGAIYAIRRELYSPLQNTDINDLLNPLQIVARGYRGHYEATAICYEHAGKTFEKEFRRKIRIVGRSLSAVRRCWPVLLPWCQPRHWFALISHKVLRWFVPFLLALTFLSSLLLWRHTLYRFLFLLQVGFYVLAFVGGLVRLRPSAPRVLHVAYYFCMVNLAALLGVFDFFRGTLSPTWQTIRQEESIKQDSAVHVGGREF